MIEYPHELSDLALAAASFLSNAGHFPEADLPPRKTKWGANLNPGLDGVPGEMPRIAVVFLEPGAVEKQCRCELLQFDENLPETRTVKRNFPPLRIGY